MHCQRVDNLLSAYIDREVSPEESREIRLHLEECAQCRSSYLQLTYGKDLLASLAQVEPPRNFHSQLLYSLETNEAEPFLARWLSQFKPLVYAGALGLLFGAIAVPLTHGVKVATIQPLSDLDFLLSEHRRFQMSEPLGSLLPPMVGDLDLAPGILSPVAVADYFAPAPIGTIHVQGEVVLTHHLRGE